MRNVDGDDIGQFLSERLHCWLIEPGYAVKMDTDMQWRGAFFLRELTGGFDGAALKCLLLLERSLAGLRLDEKLG